MKMFFGKQDRPSQNGSEVSKICHPTTKPYTKHETYVWTPPVHQPTRSPSPQHPVPRRMHSSVDTSHDVGMTTRAERTWRPWRHEGDERTPLVSHEGRASQALRLGNLRRIVVAVCGLAGLVALACVYVPAWRDAEVESKLGFWNTRGGLDPNGSCSTARVFPGNYGRFCKAVIRIDACRRYRLSDCPVSIEEAKKDLKALCEGPSTMDKTRACDALKKTEEWFPAEDPAEAAAREAEAARKAEAAKKAAEKELESKTLRDWKMLGSHDAGTGYGLASGFAGIPDLREGALVTQMTDLVTQANCGVRAFDFRIGAIKNTKENNKETVLFHHGGFFIDAEGSEVTQALASLVKWANAHPSELLVLMLKKCRTCEKCNPSSVPACDAKDNGCKEFSGNDAMQQTRLMKPFKDNRIQIHPDIDCEGENMASIMKKSKVPGGGHILVTPQGCFDDNWVKPIHWEGQAADHDFYWGEKTLDTLWSYFKSSLSKFKKGVNKKPFWLQAHWQQKGGVMNQGYYAVGMRDDMIEATTKSKINYHVLKELQDDSILRANVNVMTMNEVCHAGPEIAQVLGTTVSAADKAKCKKKCEAQGIYNRHGGETCTLDAQCQEGKCGFLRADDNDQKCCPPGQTTLKTGGVPVPRDYCTPIPDGAKCVADAHCKSGLCKGNWRGTKKGTCTRLKKGGETCSANAECQEGKCGFVKVEDNVQKCCPPGRTTLKTYAGRDYCTPMRSGETCKSDAQCERGKCGFVKVEDDVQKCCPPGRTTLKTFAGRDYCTPMRSGETCKSDAQCKSGHCAGNCWGTCNGKCK
jgi:hypothetical protein